MRAFTTYHRKHGSPREREYGLLWTRVWQQLSLRNDWLICLCQVSIEFCVALNFAGEQFKAHQEHRISSSVYDRLTSGARAAREGAQGDSVGESAIAYFTRSVSA